MLRNEAVNMSVYPTEYSRRLVEESCRNESPLEKMRKGKGNEKNLTDKLLLIASHLVPGLLCSVWHFAVL